MAIAKSFTDALPREIYSSINLDASYKSLSKTPLPKYITQLDINDIRAFDFTKNRLVEMILEKQNPYVHPYIDIDCGIDSDNANQDLLNSIITQLKILSDRGLGKYTIAGYTADEGIAKRFRFLEYKPLMHKYLSIHAVWYTVGVRYDDLADYMADLRKFSIINSDNPFCLMRIDTKVYNKGMQKFRHAMSDKPTCEKIGESYVYGFEDKKLKAVYKIKSDTEIVKSKQEKHIVNCIVDDSTKRFLSASDFSDICGKLNIDKENEIFRDHRAKNKITRNQSVSDKRVGKNKITTLPILYADAYPNELLDNAALEKLYKPNYKAREMTENDKRNAFLNNTWVIDQIIDILCSIQSKDDNFKIHCRPNGSYENELSLMHILTATVHLDGKIQKYFVEQLGFYETLLTENAKVKGDAYKNELMSAIMMGKIDTVGAYALIKYIEHYVYMLEIDNDKAYLRLRQAFKIYMHSGCNIKIEVSDFEYEGGYTFYNLLMDVRSMHSERKILKLLSRVVRYITASSSYAVKSTMDSYQIRNASDFESELRRVVFKKWDADKNKFKQMTLYDLARRYLSYISCERMEWYTDDDYSGNPVFKIYNPPTISYLKNYKPELIQRWLDLLRYGLCGDELCGYEYVLSWLAYMLKNPNKKPVSCLIFVGAEGCGKSSWVMPLGKLFGMNYFTDNANIDNVAGNFNDQYAKYRLVCINEADMHRKDQDKSNSIEAKFKALVTEDKNDFNTKHKSASVNQRSCCGYILLSNTINAITIKGDMRRYAFLTPTSKYKSDNEFFYNLRCDYANPDFTLALYSFLMDIDVSKFEFSTVPDTQMRKVVKDFSDDDQIITFLRSMIRKYVVDESGEFCKTAGGMYDDYKKYCEANGFTYQSNKNFTLHLTVGKRVIEKSRHSKNGAIYKLTDAGRMLFKNELSMDDDAVIN